MVAGTPAPTFQCEGRAKCANYSERAGRGGSDREWNQQTLLSRTRPERQTKPTHLDSRQRMPQRRHHLFRSLSSRLHQLIQGVEDRLVRRGGEGRIGEGGDDVQGRCEGRACREGGSMGEGEENKQRTNGIHRALRSCRVASRRQSPSRVAGRRRGQGWGRRELCECVPTEMSGDTKERESKATELDHGDSNLSSLARSRLTLSASKTLPTYSASSVPSSTTSTPNCSPTYRAHLSLSSLLFSASASEASLRCRCARLRNRSLVGESVERFLLIAGRENWCGRALPGERVRQRRRRARVNYVLLASTQRDEKEAKLTCSTISSKPNTSLSCPCPCLSAPSLLLASAPPPPCGDHPSRATKLSSASGS